MPEYRDNNGNVIPQQSQADRLGRNTGTVNQGIECERCSSTYFYTVHAEQFAGGGYASMEFRSLTASPMQLRICLCGQPLAPSASYVPGSRAAISAREAFYESVKIAKDYRDKVNASNLLDKIAKSTASREELAALRSEIDTRLVKLEQASKASVVNNLAPTPTAVITSDVVLPLGDPNKVPVKGKTTRGK